MRRSQLFLFYRIANRSVGVLWDFFISCRLFLRILSTVLVLLDMLLVWDKIRA